MPDDGPRRCRSSRCRAPIWFAFAAGADPHSANGNPIDHDSIGKPGGTLATWRDPDGVIRYRHLAGGEEPKAGERRAVSHFATCPDAGAFRKCPACNHRAHGTAECATLGPVTCQPVEGALVRGRFPCRCTGEGAPGG